MAGDQALRVSELAPSMATARANARQAYHAALFRAYGQSSADGVLRAAEAMAAMGDTERVDSALRLARRLAASTRNPELRDWIEHEVARIAARAPTVVSASPQDRRVGAGDDPVRANARGSSGVTPRIARRSQLPRSGNRRACR